MPTNPKPSAASWASNRRRLAGVTSIIRIATLLLDVPFDLPVDGKTSAWDKEADLLHRTLEDEYYKALQAHLEALSATAVPPAALKRKYM